MLHPPKSIIRDFELRTSQLVARITTDNQQAATLATLRDTLLPRLISGKLRIPSSVSSH